MFDEFTRFFETLAEATDEWFETLALFVEEAANDFGREVALAAEELGEYLILDLLDEAAPYRNRHVSFWIDEDPSMSWEPDGFTSNHQAFSLGHIGDPSCRYNALSPQLRCAVNPHGPCEGCKEYEPE